MCFCRPEIRSQTDLRGPAEQQSATTVCPSKHGQSASMPGFENAFKQATFDVAAKGRMQRGIKIRNGEQNYLIAAGNKVDAGAVSTRTLIQDLRKVFPQPKDRDRSLPVPSGITATCGSGSSRRSLIVFRIHATVPSPPAARILIFLHTGYSTIFSRS